MKARLSTKLGPRAQMAALMPPPGSVAALVELRGVLSFSVRAELEAAGATVDSAMDEARLVSVHVEPRRLGDLAELDSVNYVEVATPLQNPT